VVAWAGPSPREYAALTSLLFATMIYTHRGNIRRLIRHTEKPL